MHGSMLFKRHLDKQCSAIYQSVSVLKQILVGKSKPRLPIFQLLAVPYSLRCLKKRITILVRKERIHFLKWKDVSSDTASP